MSEYERWCNWMAQQVGRDDGIGDLAGDMQRDPATKRITIVRRADGRHTHIARPITTVFGFLRWLRAWRTEDRAVLQWVGIAYAEWRQRTRPGVTVRTRFLVFKRDAYRCQLCGRSARDGAVLEVDHVIPHARGGTSDMSNLQTLCWDCNRGKRDSLQ